MKKKFNILAIFVISMFLCTNISVSQSLNWETAIPVSLSINTFSNTSIAQKSAYDNYGVHIVARNITNNNLNYYLFGNNGELLQQITNFAETGIYGFDLISYQGSVYAITIKNTTFKVYKKNNSLTSSFQLVTQSTPSDYNTGLQGYNDLIETDVIESNGRFYFVWDDAGYFPSSGQNGDIGILSYNVSSNSLFFNGSIENSQSFPNYGGGASPSLAVNGNDIYFSYTWPTPEPPPNPLEKFFVFRKDKLMGMLFHFQIVLNIIQCP